MIKTIIFHDVLKLQQNGKPYKNQLKQPVDKYRDLLKSQGLTFREVVINGKDVEFMEKRNIWSDWDYSHGHKASIFYVD